MSERLAYGVEIDEIDFMKRRHVVRQCAELGQSLRRESLGTGNGDVPTSAWGLAVPFGQDPNHITSMSARSVRKLMLREVRNALSVFSAACWQWNRLSSSSGGSAARSCSAARRSAATFVSHACTFAARAGSDGIEQLPLAQDGGRKRGDNVAPTVELLTCPDLNIGCYAESPQ